MVKWIVLQPHLMKWNWQIAECVCVKQRNTVEFSKNIENLLAQTF